jgi:hypothetical protein
VGTRRGEWRDGTNEGDGTWKVQMYSTPATGRQASLVHVTTVLRTKSTRVRCNLKGAAVPQYPRTPVPPYIDRL